MAYNPVSDACLCLCVWVSECVCVCVCKCVSVQVYSLCERWALTTGRPPCPLAISVPCLPQRRLRNDLGDSDRSLFVVSISHNWALVPEGQVYRIRTGLHNAENTDTPLMWNEGCVCVSLRLRAVIDFRQQKSSCAEVDRWYAVSVVWGCWTESWWLITIQNFHVFILFWTRAAWRIIDTQIYWETHKKTKTWKC